MNCFLNALSSRIPKCLTVTLTAAAYRIDHRSTNKHRGASGRFSRFINPQFTTISIPPSTSYSTRSCLRVRARWNTLVQNTHAYTHAHTSIEKHNKHSIYRTITAPGACARSDTRKYSINNPKQTTHSARRWALGHAGVERSAKLCAQAALIVVYDYTECGR